MRGKTRVFTTKQDFSNGLELYPEETKSALRSLIEGRFHFVKVAELSENEDGICDAEHFVAVESTENGQKRYQMERQENPNARLFRLGFTVAEAKKLIQ